MIRLARGGAGITFGMGESFRPFFARGALAPLLEGFRPCFLGFIPAFSAGGTARRSCGHWWISFLYGKIS